MPLAFFKEISSLQDYVQIGSSQTFYLSTKRMGSDDSFRIWIWSGRSFKSGHISQIYKTWSIFNYEYVYSKNVLFIYLIYIVYLCLFCNFCFKKIIKK